jgi:hypothetical protein
MTHTTTEVQSPLTQAEKRREMEQDRKATTFRSFADAFVSENRGGRFGKSGNDQTVKPLPPESPWSGAQPAPGDELPLGYDINAVPDLGFPLNKQSATAPSAVSPCDVETTDEQGGVTVERHPSLSLLEVKR